MLGLDRRAARYTWTAFLVLLSMYVVYLLRKTLFIFVLSLLFAYLLAPLVNLLDRLLPASRTRTPALALAYVLFVAGLVLLGIQVGTRVVDQANRLAKDLPGLLEKWKQPSTGAAPQVNSVKEQILSGIEDQVRGNFSHLLAALPQAGLKALAVASDVVYVIVIPILAFFFLKDSSSLKEHFLEGIDDARRRALLEDLMADVHLLLAHYMRALVLLSLATLVAYNICFLIAGVPYPVLLAVLAAALEFLPMIGPLAAAVVILIVTAVSGASILPILIFMGVYRVFQDYVLSPHIMGHGVEMHPLLVIFGVFSGAEIAGIPGAFLSVPVLALMRIGYRRLQKARAATRLTPAAQV